MPDNTFWNMHRRSDYSDRVLSHTLRRLEPNERLAAATEILTSQPFDVDVCHLVAAELKGIGDEVLRSWMELLPEHPATAFVKAQLAVDHMEICAAWDRFLLLHPRRDPFDLLAYARALAGCGQYERAATQLRVAMSQPVRYSFFARAEKLITKLASAGISTTRACRIAVLGSSTTSLLAPLLGALCLRDRIKAEIYQGLYGAIQQEALDPNSGLARFRPDIVLVVMHWHDLSLEAVTAHEGDVLDRVTDEHRALWKTLSDAFGCHVVQHAYDFPAEEPYGYLAGVLPGGRTRLIEKINTRLREEAPMFVSVLDTPAVQRHVGSDRWEDAMAWSSFRQHPAADALPELAEAQMAHIRAVLGLTRKVLVTDLDNTLWKGVIGEDGLNGIGIGPGTPAGEAHQRLQAYLLDLKRRGILLTVCSKNNPADARLPFEQHPNMLLRMEDFAAFRANWDDKVTNLQAIARDLSLGLDSFVFLDDNPLEREWVRSQLPQVAVIELGSSVFHYVRDLDRGRYFHALSLSAEDLQRAEQYRTEVQRDNLRASAASLDEFLSQLQLQAFVEPVTENNLARVIQLVNKTNQFNVTTRRYTEAQVRAKAEDPRGWAGAFHMSDRMGSYGLIGVLFCVPGSAAGEWEIDTWLMSCRTLGRQMEKFMFDRVADAAIASGIHRVTGVYRPTQKNVIVKELFDQLGFTQVSQSADETRYTWTVPAVQIPTATHVRDIGAPIEAVAHP
jgi:FkbH-like protein